MIKKIILIAMAILVAVLILIQVGNAKPHIAVDYTEHLVLPGDTLEEIVAPRTKDIQYARLQAKVDNELESADKLEVGMILRIREEY